MADFNGYSFKDKKTNRVVQLDPVFYVGLLPPNGFLNNQPACHALWHYFCTAMEVYKDEKEPVKYEGNMDELSYSYFNLWKAIATLYNVHPGDMANYWPLVDKTAYKVNVTPAPLLTRIRNPAAAKYGN